jgi:hypothetical protein
MMKSAVVVDGGGSTAVAEEYDWFFYAYADSGLIIPVFT